ncbi:MAG: tetratricopeptide repeat protein [Myxococcales bacterium]|nr:tetratricopeptide repeat protein [Myxococcales bacterium]
MSKNKGTHGRGKKPTEEPDEFVQRVTSFGDIIQPHIKKVVVIAGLTMAGLIAWKAMDWRHKEKAKDATTAYVSAMKVIETPVVEEGDPKPPESPVAVEPHTSMEAHRSASLAALAKVSSGHGGIALAKLAGPHEARLLLDQGKYDEALAAFQEFSKSDAPEPLRMAALEGAAYSLEAKAMANEDAAARQAGLEVALQSFANLQPAEGGPMRDYSLYHQGRLLVAMGKLDDGVAKFKQVLTEQPDSPLKVVVEGRLASLDTGDSPIDSK